MKTDKDSYFVAVKVFLENKKKELLIIKDIFNDGWDLPGDSAFKNTIFVNYKVFNRSQRAYYNTYLGVFTDIDLGLMTDDFIGCDVYRGSYYGYNGKAIDGNGQSYAYGEHPPAQTVTFPPIRVNLRALFTRLRMMVERSCLSLMTGEVSSMW